MTGVKTAVAVLDDEDAGALGAVGARPEHHALQRHREHVRALARDDLGVAGQAGPQARVGVVESHDDLELARRGAGAADRQRARADLDDLAAETSGPGSASSATAAG